VSLDLSKLEKVRVRNGKTIARCPNCALSGQDEKAEHLFIGDDGGYRCIVECDSKAIFALAGNRDSLPTSGPCVARPIPKPKRLDLLARIKADFPATVADLWEASPVRCDEDIDEARAFLRQFPHNAVLWIADDVRKTGRPEHTLYFRTRAEWEEDKITAPGTRIAPSSFRHGTISRKAANVEKHLFAVIESDDIGEGKKYASKDEFCSLIRWLREGCGWQLSAVVDSGNRSLHAWFKHPGAIDMEHLTEHAAALGLDGKFSESSQPWRLPGVKREGSGTRQSLIYLSLEGSL
jgi:hypothetical protein